MKKNDIISELFSYLKNETFEERLIDISNLLNQFYMVENDFEKIRKLSRTTVKRYLEIIIHVVNGNSQKVIDEKEIESFLNNISNIDYVSFKKKLSKYNLFRFFRKEFGLDQKAVENISALVLILSLTGGAFFVYNEIDKTFIDVDYSAQKSAMVALTNKPSIDDNINSVLKNVKDEVKKEEEKRIENDESKVALEEPSPEPSTDLSVSTEGNEDGLLEENSQNIVDDHMDDLVLPEETIPSKEPLEPLNINKPVTNNHNLGEYEIPYTPTDPNKKEQTLEQEIIQYILDKYGITLEQFDIIKAIIIAEAKPDSFDDGYAVTNTIYNRTQSEKWLYTAEWCYKDKNGNRLKFDGNNIYDVVISPYQFEVYGNGRYKQYLDKNDGPVYDSIIAFFNDLRNGNYENMHNFLNFKSSEIEMSCYFEQPAGRGGNKYHGLLTDNDRIEKQNSRS